LVWNPIFLVSYKALLSHSQNFHTSYYFYNCLTRWRASFRQGSSLIIWDEVYLVWNLAHMRHSIVTSHFHVCSNNDKNGGSGVIVHFLNMVSLHHVQH
jgi:hypothetical protein